MAQDCRRACHARFHSGSYVHQKAPWMATADMDVKALPLVLGRFTFVPSQCALFLLSNVLSVYHVLSCKLHCHQPDAINDS